MVLGHVTYPGDATDVVGSVVGMSAFGEHLVAVEATRSPDGTRVGFALATTDDFKAFFGKADAKIANLAQHPAFGGS